MREADTEEDGTTGMGNEPCCAKFSDHESWLTKTRGFCAELQAPPLIVTSTQGFNLNTSGTVLITGMHEYYRMHDSNVHWNVVYLI